MERKTELNYMNAVGCLLVILIHVLSLGISNAERSSVQAAVIYFPWRLASFVVPMFLYTGAVKMAQQFDGKTITLRVYADYCLRRVQKIYLPYVIWVMIYYLCFWRIGYVKGELRELFSYLLIGNLSSLFYYIVIVMQFYFLMPLWIWIIRHVPFQLSLGTSLLLTFCMQQFGGWMSLLSVPFRYTDRLFLTYIFFWIWGLYAGKDYERAKSLLIRGKRAGAACGGVIALCAALAYLQYRGVPVPVNMNDVKLAADYLAIVSLHSLCVRWTKAPARFQTILGAIARSSFFVYLSHCLFLTLGTYHAQQLGLNRLSVLLPVRALICYIVPFVLFFVLKKLEGRMRRKKA